MRLGPGAPRGGPGPLQWGYRRRGQHTGQPARPGEEERSGTAGRRDAFRSLSLNKPEEGSSAELEEHVKTHERCEDGAAQESARGQKGAGMDETVAGRGGGWAPPRELHVRLPAEDFAAPGIWARPCDLLCPVEYQWPRCEQRLEIRQAGGSAY